MKRREFCVKLYSKQHEIIGDFVSDFIIEGQ